MNRGRLVQSSTLAEGLSVAVNPTCPILLTSITTDPSLPTQGSSRSRIVSPVTGHHLQLPLRTGCPSGP
jgi:hypothetical protein